MVVAKYGATVRQIAVLALLLLGLPLVEDCLGQTPSAYAPGSLQAPSEKAQASNPRAELTSKIRQHQLVTAERVVRRALRHLPFTLRFEDCQLVGDLETTLKGFDPSLIRQARDYDAFVLGNHYPIFLNLDSPLLQNAMDAYRQEPMHDSIFIYLLAAVLMHERVHAGEPSSDPQGCAKCDAAAASPLASAANGSADEGKAYQAELDLLRQFRNLRYIDGQGVDRYIAYVEKLARTSGKHDLLASR